MTIVFPILSLFALNFGRYAVANAPGFISEKGSLKICPGYNKNISFEVVGEESWINIGQYDILHVLGDAINSTHSISRVSTSLSESHSSFTQAITEQFNGTEGIFQRLTNLENEKRNTSHSILSQYVQRRQFQQLKNRVLNLSRRAFSLQTRINNILKSDRCSSTPCQNGGTCVDNYKGYTCICPKNWEGPQCSKDVNECSNFAGTDLGCQNGATCVNTPGNYECRCSLGWFGLHCTRRTGNNCANSTNEEICGHGICVPQSNADGYKCICDQGWTTNNFTPSCTVDVNECQGNRYPCSTIPMVPCINMPGTFHCGACPAGYSGNGYYCADIDECLTYNGGCSVNPKVDCINTIGSRMCGSCPPGYQGNGVVCTFVGLCQINNGGCHMFADCFTNPMIGPAYVQCRCKAGYSGTGYGPLGCIPTSNTGIAPPPNAIVSVYCDPNPCVHGTCRQTPSGRECICDDRYTGALCDQMKDPCNPQPCLNGGTCIKGKTSMGYRCECTSRYTGQNCNTRTSACGGVRDMPEGRISYPDTNSASYSHNSKCVWVIDTQYDKVLNVTFTKFDLEMSSDCLYDWLQIHDGRNSAGHNIGRFCGNTLPMGGNIISTTNSLYLWFRSDNTVSKNGFEISWTSIDPICGKHINVTSHGIITSPGTPGKYPNNRDCMWVISAPLDKRIELHFFTMQLETSHDCEKDYLVIYEGPTLDDIQLAKYCGSIHPSPLLIASPSALLHFHSDNTNNDVGFQISYAVIEGEVGCGATYTQVSGEISPPRVDGKYSHRITCQYKIILAPDNIIKLTFAEFSLERSTNCKFDYVAIYDGDSVESGMIGKYCGTEKPPAILSTSNKVLIVFVSDESLNDEGFKIVYEKICHHVYEGLSGLIHSPGYPKTYPSQSVCTFLIKAPIGNAIVLNFVDFDLEEASPDYSAENDDSMICKYDHLQIYDGEKATNETKIGKYCGPIESKPSEIISTHNMVYMEFTSDMSISGTGFKVNYTTIDIGCGGILKEKSGNIEYPDPSKNSEINANKICRWTLSAPESHVVQITKNLFDLEDKLSCQAEYLEISNNDTVTGKNEVLGRYCGTDFPSVITSSSNMMTINLKHTSDRPGSGISFHYIYLDVRKHCGGTYLSSSGVITSPGWPNKYPAEKDCKWIIRVPDGQQIALNVTKFQLETCQFAGDYLEIRNGGYENAPLIGKFCGTNIPLIIPSLTNSLFLHFRSDKSMSQMGFHITWDSTSTGCGGILTSSSGSIISPNYPNKYGHNAECLWRITTSAGSRIQLSFVTLELETIRVCLFDYVEIDDGFDGADKIGRYCSLDRIHGPIVSKTNHVFVRFRTDGTSSSTGFMLNYNIMCNIDLSGFHGVIESPNFPEKYPDRMDCNWTINAPIGNKINITFTHLDLEEAVRISYSGTTHWFDYVKLTEGSNTNNTRMYSGNVIPPQYQSVSNKVMVHFHTDHHLRKTGFRLQWLVVGCGGELRQPSGTLTSPGYPRLGPGMIECHWRIQVDQDKSVSFNLDDMDTNRSCDKNSLKVFNGPSEKFSMLLNVCGKQDRNSSRVTSTGNYLYVVLHNELLLSFARGLKATYESVNSKCGGIFAGSGLITSPNYPKNYGNSMECFYYLTVPEFHTMTLKFTDFDLASYGENNCADNVKVYDGNSVESKLIGVYCGSDIANVITSTSNNLTVVFKSDKLINAKGFMANYSATCGSKIITNGEGIISKITYFENCTWTIISEKEDEKVSLTVTHLETLKNENCSNDNYVEIFAGESMSSPSLGKYCGTKIPPTIVSRGNALTIAIVPFYVRSSIIFHYSVMKTACGGNLSSIAGEFTSPMYPDSYSPNLNCIWTINVTPGNKITLTFDKFKLPTSEDCIQDYLEIREENGLGKLIGVYCDAVPPLIKSTKSVWIKFSSDSEGGDDGFIAQYSYDTFNEISYAQDYESMGQLTSPLYPHQIVSNVTYEWRIIAKSGFNIQIKIVDLSIPTYSGNECYEFLVIYDGYADDYPILGKYCGVQIPEPVQSTSNTVYIKLIKKITGYHASFKLEWTGVSETLIDSTINKNCGGNKTTFIEAGNMFILKSPGYPNGYNESLFCEWIFETAPTQHLVLKFRDVSLEETVDCMADKILLYERVKDTDQWQQIGSPICLPNATLSDDIQVHASLKIVFASDFAMNKSGFAAVIFSDCGNLMTQSSGIIQPLRPRVLRFGPRYLTDCEWDISVRHGRTIKVEFMEFNITNSNNACTVYVTVRNGGTNHSPFLGKGKYCDSLTLDSNLTTTSNRLHIAFHLPVSPSTIMSKDTFKIRFTEIPLICGDKIMLNDDFNSTIITSPNYPNIPNPYTECSWVFVGQAVHRLSLNFIDKLDLKTTKGCEDEYVEVRDGGTDFSPLLGRFCDARINTIKSRSNMLFFKYFTGIPVPQHGFKAKVSIDICGGTIYGTEGSIISPKRMTLGFVRGTVVCDWYIIGPENHIVYVSLLNIRIVKSENCSETFLQIFDMVTNPLTNATNPPLTDKICDRNSEKTAVTTSNGALVRLTIPDTSVRTDNFYFVIQFNTSEESCGGDINQPSGVIEVPKFKSEYHHCHWKITVPKGRRIKLTVEQSPSLSYYLRSRYWMSVYSGHTTTGFLDSFTSTNKVARTTQVNTLDNKMTMLLYVKSDGTPIPIKLRYSSDEPSACDGVFANDEGIITPPIVNLTKAHCEYEYRPSDNEFKGTLMIEYNGENINDCLSRKDLFKFAVYVSIPAVMEKMATFCPTTRVLSPYARTTIFMQRTTLNTTGYPIRYKLYNCGGNMDNIRDGSNIIFSLPTNHTGPLRCVWVINIPQGQFLQMKRNQMIFDSKSCNDEYFLVRLGRTQGSKLNTKICHNHNTDGVLYLHEPHTWFEYQTENFSSNTLLNISLSVTSEEPYRCGGELEWEFTRNHVLTTPNFPNQYTENTECEWILGASKGHRVSLSFEHRFYMESSPNCTKDYVEISDFKSGKWIVGGRYCGRTVPPGFNSSEGKLKVLFHSDEAINGDGFQVRWTELCGGTYEVTSVSQVLASPSKSGELNCTFKFICEEGKMINLDFNYLFFHPGGNCENNRLTITSNDGEEIFCGTNTPQRKRISGPTVSLHFKAKDEFFARGFRLSYYLDKCGGNITKSGEVITSLSNDNQYLHSLHCVWYIKAPKDKAVTLSFRAFKLEYGVECGLDSVKVYDGFDKIKDEIPMAMLCGDLTTSLPVIKSKGNEMVVVFTSDTSVSNEGFVGNIIFTYDEAHGCGGSMNVTTSPTPFHIFSNEPKYHPYLDCHWVIHAPMDNSVNIRFKDFNISKCLNSTITGKCDCDYLEVRDGLSSQAELIGRYCGNVLPETITTSGIFLWMRFVSDGTVESSGIQMDISASPSICGPSVLNNTKKVQVLESPGFSSGILPKNIKCEWLLYTSSSNYHILFTDFDVGPKPPQNNQCGPDYVLIKSEAMNPFRIEAASHIYSLPYHVKDESLAIQLSHPPKKLCGSIQHYEDFLYMKSKLRIRLVTSNTAVQYKGFRLQYSEVGCSSNLTKSYGKIQYMNDFGYLEKAECKIIITAPPNHTISIYLYSFRASNADCQNNYFDVIDGISKDSPSLAKYCDSQQKSALFSTGNNVTVNFNVKDVFFYEYVFSYVATNKGRGCGGTILDSSGQIYSPFYPGTYKEEKVCEWVIVSPETSIKLTFEVFDIGFTTSCESNYLELFDKDGMSLNKYCSRGAPAPFTILNDYVKISYHTSTNNYGSGWLIIFDTVPA